MTNGIWKVRKGVDIFYKRILVLVSSSLTQCFRIPPRLHQSCPCSRQSRNWYHSAWCTTFQDSTLYVSIFLVSGMREREERERERERTPPSLHYYFLFFQVGCSATGFCSVTRNWRELYCSELPWCLHRTRFNPKNLRLSDEFGYLKTAIQTCY